MNVLSYMFQSPSPQRVQVGTPDTNVTQEDTSTQAQDSAHTEDKTLEITKEASQQELEHLEKKSKQHILDIYV